MSTTTLDPGFAHPAPIPAARQIPSEHYVNVDYGWKSWLLTLDPKRIGILYLLSVTVVFFLAGPAALLGRLNLLARQGLSLPPDIYTRMFPMHGVGMVFFSLTPPTPAVFGNFLIPLMLG